MNINPAAVDTLSAVEGITTTIAADAVATPQANPVAAPQANPVAAPPANTAAGVAPQANVPALPSFNDAAIMFDDGVATAAAAAAVAAPAQGNTTLFDDGVAAAAAAAAAPAQGNTTCILSYEIEGIRNLEPHVQWHATAFYNIIVPLFEAAGDTYKIMDRVKYYRIMGALQRARDGELLSSLHHEFRQIHIWNKVFAVVVAGGSTILVSHPKEMIGEENIDAELVRRVSYLEIL